jgi:hypothetical protein
MKNRLSMSFQEHYKIHIKNMIQAWKISLEILKNVHLPALDNS